MQQPLWSRAVIGSNSAWGRAMLWLCPYVSVPLVPPPCPMGCNATPPALVKAPFWISLDAGAHEQVTVGVTVPQGSAMWLCCSYGAIQSVPAKLLVQIQAAQCYAKLAGKGVRIWCKLPKQAPPPSRHGPPTSLPSPHPTMPCSTLPHLSQCKRNIFGATEAGSGLHGPLHIHALAQLVLKEVQTCFFVLHNTPGLEQGTCASPPASQDCTLNCRKQLFYRNPSAETPKPQNMLKTWLWSTSGFAIANIGKL